MAPQSLISKHVIFCHFSLICEVRIEYIKNVLTLLQSTYPQDYAATIDVNLKWKLVPENMHAVMRIFTFALIQTARARGDVPHIFQKSRYSIEKSGFRHRSWRLGQTFEFPSSESRCSLRAIPPLTISPSLRGWSLSHLFSPLTRYHPARG